MDIVVCYCGQLPIDCQCPKVEVEEELFIHPISTWPTSNNICNYCGDICGFCMECGKCGNKEVKHMGSCSYYWKGESKKVEKFTYNLFPPSNANQKYKVFIWKANGEDDIGNFAGWTLITKEVVLKYDEVKVIIDKSLDASYIVFARKTGNQKSPFIGAIYSFPAGILSGISFAKELYKQYLKDKKGVSSYDQLKVEPIYPKAKKPKFNTYADYVPYAAKVEEKVDPNATWILDQLACKTFPAKSQKIKGLRYATDVIGRVVDPNIIGKATVITEEPNMEIKHSHYPYGRKTKEEVIASMLGNFCRPCPQNPEHGFVDSRLISNETEALAILKEIADTGEKPEMIVMPKIDCDFSGVICPDGIAFGKGHDGATAGNGAVEIKLSLPPEGREKVRKSFWKGTEDWPFVEVLYNSHPRPIMVQMRSGPSLEVKAKKVKIMEVHEVDSSQDLIEWGKEAKVIRAKVVELNRDNDSEVENTIAVWHPGGAFLSHFGVHCRTVEPTLPYITSYDKPVIGSEIEIGIKKKAKLSAIRDGLLEGLGAEIEGEYGNWQRAVNDLNSFLGALHISSIADLGDEITAKFIGYTWGIGARVIAALPFGECTHQPKASENYVKVIGINHILTHERDYGKIWGLPLETVLAGLMDCYNSFTTMKWQSGYGGQAWGNCTTSLLGVFDKMRKFIELPSTLSFNELVDKINIMVNEAHNGGWWLNKMSTKQIFDDASILPHFLLNPKRAMEVKDIKIGAFSIKLKVADMLKKLDMADMAKKIEEVAKKAALEAEIEKKKAIEAAKKAKLEAEKAIKEILEGQKEMAEKVGFGKKGQFQWTPTGDGSINVHIQVKSPVHDEEHAYGASIDVKVDGKVAPLFQALYQGYKNPKTINGKDESFTTKGKFNYVPISFYKDSSKEASINSTCYFLVSGKLIPVVNGSLWMLLDNMEKGEASGVTSSKKVIEAIKKIAKEEVEYDKCWCGKEDKCLDCGYCTDENLNPHNTHSPYCGYSNDENSNA